VGLTYLDNEPLRHVRAFPLYRERYLLLTPADGRLGARESITWAEAADEPLCLLTPDMQNRRIVDGLFAEAGAPPRPVLETNSISTLHAHVRADSLSSVVAHPWLREHGVPDGLVAIPLVAPERAHGIGLVLLDRDPEPLLARAVLEVARSFDLQAALDVGPGPWRGDTIDTGSVLSR
jgi:DNA-binding transcriptional LysR family regulator